MSALYVYLSKYPEALEVKVEAFLAKFITEKKEKDSLLHLRRVEYETVQNNLTQLSVFSEYTYYIFEEYLGSFQELSKLFEKTDIQYKVLITKTVDYKKPLPFNLLKKIANRECFLFLPSFKLKEQYLFNLSKRLKLKIPEKYLESIKEEAFSSIFLIKGVLAQLKLMFEGGEELDMDKLRELVKANEVDQRTEEKYLFLNWYLSRKVRLWAIFLRELNKKPREVIIDFLRYFSFTINSYLWSNKLEVETVKFIQEFSYNYFLFLERELFKIKSDSSWVLIYFFWKNQPKTSLVLNS